MKKNKTLQYYDDKAALFSTDTAGVDMHTLQDEFLKKIPENASILDLGCGSGRDTVYFMSHNCTVTAVDGSKEICRIASERIGFEVRQLLFDELDYFERFDGIWACASLLHVEKDVLPRILKKIAIALKSEGVLYASFKYGDFSGDRNGRFYCDFDEASFNTLLEQVPELRLQEYIQTYDVRPEHSDEKWLNIFMIKAD